jgi:hypothetical protein
LRRRYQDGYRNAVGELRGGPLTIQQMRPQSGDVTSTRRRGEIGAARRRQ